MRLRLVSRRSGIFQLALVMAALVSCGTAQLSEPPEEIVGTWRTSAPGYERSFFTIEPKRVTISMGTFELYQYPIERIDHTVDRRGHERYVLHYTAVEGYADSIELTLESGNPPTLTAFSSRDDIIRASDGAFYGLASAY